MTLYRAANDHGIHAGMCLTDDLAVAREYAAQYGRSAVYAVEIDEDDATGPWAGMGEIVAADLEVDSIDEEHAGRTERVYTGTGTGLACEAVDRPAVRALLAAQGYSAAQYREPWTYGGADMSGARSHWMLVVLDPAIVRSVEPVVESTA